MFFDIFLKKLKKVEKCRACGNRIFCGRNMQKCRLQGLKNRDGININVAYATIRENSGHTIIGIKIAGIILAVLTLTAPITLSPTRMITSDPVTDI